MTEPENIEPVDFEPVDLSGRYTLDVSGNPEDLYTQRETTEAIAAALEGIPTAHALTLRLMYGIGVDATTLVECGKLINRSHEATRRRLWKALKIIRHPNRNNRLREYY